MKKEDLVISIITPYYKTLKEIKSLAKILEPQLTEDVEWIIIDDGCNEKELDKLKAKVIHLEKNTGGASIPRNTGIDVAKGKYIAFIDGDDKVANNYVAKIKEKLTDNFDYCYISWKSKHHNIVIKDEPPEWNCCVWNCVYKKSLIGEERFNPIYKKGEDYDFNIRVRKGIKSNIEDILYIYNEDNPLSLTKQPDYYVKEVIE